MKKLNPRGIDLYQSAIIERNRFYNLIATAKRFDIAFDQAHLDRLQETLDGNVERGRLEAIEQLGGKDAKWDSR